MEHAEVVRRRRAVRRFVSGAPVDRAVLDRLVAAAVRGPTAGGTDGVSLLVLHRPGDVGAFWEATAEPGAGGAWLDGMRTAPVVVVVLALPGAYAERYARPDKARASAERGGADVPPADWAVPWWDVDAGMAALLLLLGAVDEGLGGCPFGVPPPRWGALRDRFAIHPGARPVVAVALGQPAPAPTAGPRTGAGVRRRAALADVVSDGRAGHPWRVATDGAGPPA